MKRDEEEKAERERTAAEAKAEREREAEEARQRAVDPRFDVGQWVEDKEFGLGQIVVRKINNLVVRFKFGRRETLLDSRVAPVTPRTFDQGDRVKRDVSLFDKLGTVTGISPSGDIRIMWDGDPEGHYFHPWHSLELVTPVAEVIPPIQFAPGDRVLSSHWGLGTVEEVRNSVLKVQWDDEECQQPPALATVYNVVAADARGAQPPAGVQEAD